MPGWTDESIDWSTDSYTKGVEEDGREHLVVLKHLLNLTAEFISLELEM